MVESQWSYRGSHGVLAARTWTARDSQPNHVVLIAHGYGERIGRYEHVATPPAVEWLRLLSGSSA